MTDWEERIRIFWSDASGADPEFTFGSMQALISERRDDDPAAIFEWASVHDFLGRDAEAIPLYRRALELGLDPVRNFQAQIQLASSLRNIGESAEAVRILEGMKPEATAGDAHEAFLALALFDAGRPGDALRVALKALGKTLPLYSGAIDHYADAIVDSK